MHDSYPGQFGALAQYLHDQGWRVAFATLDDNLPKNAPYQMFGYTPHRAPSAQTHPYAQSYDRAVLQGQACARRCAEARNAGDLSADIIISHVGPGAGLFLREVFPTALIVAYCEWWYQSPGIDTLYLMALDGHTANVSLDDLILARSRNASISAELLSADLGLCPTHFQADQFPIELRQKISVLHDGVDTDYYAPLAQKDRLGQAEHPALAQIPKNAQLVTYATRGMEPHRGFPQVFKAFWEISKEWDNVYFVLAGENTVFYGSDQDRRVDWLERCKAAYPIAPDRLIFTGTLNKYDYRWLLRRSCVHVYCTVPFVLSWSLLEAMSVGTRLVVSDVEPIREVMPDDGAIFADLLIKDGLKNALSLALSDQEATTQAAKATRARVATHYRLADFLDKRRCWLLHALDAKKNSGT
ncbi:glycosyltransferase [Roseobacter fucihabitans]|uniref:glycosyltransferase n=1 Tax=Roseobacter fucihabitans TaxID=1537242 RepID=UPI00292A412A|nr:glycosyltransferase [Roseobacter litoralis]